MSANGGNGNGTSGGSDQRRKRRLAVVSKSAPNSGNGSGNSSAEKPAAPDLKEIDRALTQIARKDPLTWTSRLGDVGKAIEEWREAIIDDLGGEDHVTAMQRVVIDIAAKTLIMLDVCDQFILNPEDQRILDLDRGQMHFIIMQRKALADSLERYMRDLGFARKRAPRRVAEIMESLLEEGDDLDRETLLAAREDAHEFREPEESESLPRAGKKLDPTLEATDVGIDPDPDEDNDVAEHAERPKSVSVADPDEIVDDEHVVDITPDAPVDLTKPKKD